LALAAALYLSDKILSSPACGELLRRLKLSGTGCLWKLLLARGVVIRAGASIDSFRRQIFRELLKRQ
ncbi:MAG: hypothetical protein KAU28_09715, partial [Phycisphaerae bacterium]|nr:hypothetical protein [Phycisphaerae bacterium]